MSATHRANMLATRADRSTYISSGILFRVMESGGSVVSFESATAGQPPPTDQSDNLNQRSLTGQPPVDFGNSAPQSRRSDGEPDRLRAQDNEAASNVATSAPIRFGNFPRIGRRFCGVLRNAQGHPLRDSYHRVAANSDFPHQRPDRRLRSAIEPPRPTRK